MSYTLQNFDIEDFLANYWQKKPLLIRNAFAQFSSVISPEELAGLACDEAVYSRLLIEKDGAHPWQLVNGPFNDDDFLNLPETHYSLLVSECDKWLPELTALVDCFNFIPQWRIDDLMISYAPQHGSVGPHLDQYDVFLIQAHGQRHWHIQDPKTLDNRIIDGLDVALLQNFKHDEDWVLNPGDMLYLPPGVAHHGIALNPCMTYSVGFRAPSSKEVFEGMVQTLAKHNILSEQKRYTDPKLSTQRHQAEINNDDVQQVQQLISQAIQQASQLMPQISGEIMTQKILDLELACNSDYDYQQQSLLERHPDALFAYYKGDTELQFFANGHCFTLQNELLDCVQFICEQRSFCIKQIPNIHFENVKSFLNNLLQRSLLLIIDEH